MSTGGSRLCRIKFKRYRTGMTSDLIAAFLSFLAACVAHDATEHSQWLSQLLTTRQLQLPCCCLSSSSVHASGRDSVPERFLKGSNLVNIHAFDRKSHIRVRGVDLLQRNYRCDRAFGTGKHVLACEECCARFFGSCMSSTRYDRSHPTTTWLNGVPFFWM